MALRHGVVLAVLAAVAPSLALGQGAALPPFREPRVPKPPTVATGDGASFRVFELHVTNFAGQTMTLKPVEVASAGENVRRVLLVRFPR